MAVAHHSIVVVVRADAVRNLAVDLEGRSDSQPIFVDDFFQTVNADVLSASVSD